jgi:hypothetical protein
VSNARCATCGGSGVVRKGGFDHSGQVEWDEKCPSCGPPPKPDTIWDKIGVVIGIIVVGGFFLWMWLKGGK